MEGDCLRKLIQLQHNESELNDQQFISLLTQLIHKLKRSELSSILFCGLNAMRMKGYKSTLNAQHIIQESLDITFKIKTKHKIKWHQRNASQYTMVPINKMITFSNIPSFLLKSVCDYLDIKSLLNLQLINRYLFVITRKHCNYWLLLTVSPFYNQHHTIASIEIQSSNHEQQYNHENNNNNTNYLHSVNENALNCGYYKKFFIPTKKLGSGSYGSVYLVQHLMHGIYLGEFAIKLICVGDDYNRLNHILREVRTLQQLHHRNVIDYKHSWLENYQPAVNCNNAPQIPCLFMLMEYANMGSVYDYIMNKKKWLSEHEIWTIMFETCMGLQSLHERGIVHRDVKPGNILMTSLHKRHTIEYKDLELYNTDYRIVISDLGQADFVHCKESVSETGNTGALGFAAPELILKDDMNQWDETVDIWSLGQLLYFLSFSRMPCYAQNEDDDIEDVDVDIDIKMFYRDIVNGNNTLWFPSNHKRSVLIPNMIQKLAQIDPRKRPNLVSLIVAICNILRSHQYISISYSNNNNVSNHRALIAPQRCSTNTNISTYPVVKYEPKYHNFQNL